jgi:hypothetical protein
MEIEKISQEIKQFAEKIVPPNWNIYYDPEEFRYKPGTLNIHLLIQKEKNDELSPLEDEDHEFVGVISGPMHFYQVSTFKKNAGAMKAIEQYGDGSIARITFVINLIYGADEEAIVHELAHIAAVRYKAQQIGKNHRDRSPIVTQEIERGSRHGPLFQKALHRMIIRTEAALGREAAKIMWVQLDMYRKDPQ